MKKTRGAAVIVALISLVTLLGKILLGLFFSIVVVMSSGIGIVLLIVLGLSSLVIGSAYHRKLHKFMTHRKQIQTIALLMLLGAVVWTLILILPHLNVAINDATTTARPLWQAALLLVASFIILLKVVDIAVNRATELAEMIGVSPFVISFFIVGIVSALPESTISVISNLKGDANGAASALLSSNVADLALVFGIIAILLRGSKIKSEALKKDALYLPILLLPLALMYDGHLSRIDGAILLVAGLLFFSVIARQVDLKKLRWPGGMKPVTTLLLLLGSLAIMLAAANVTVTTAGDVGTDLGVPSVIISVLVVGIGVCLPELLFAIQSVWKHREGLALGNVLSVVMIDATIMLGITALLRPMVINAGFFLVTNVFMGLAALCIIYFARFVRRLGWQEGVVMLAVYAAYLYFIIAR